MDGKNKDVSESVRFQDLLESLKMNKEINGQAKYVGEHILPRLDTVEKQKVKEVTEFVETEVWWIKGRRVRRVDDRLDEL